MGWSDTQLSFNSELIPTLKFMLMVKEETPFKDISYLELWQLSETICAISVSGVMRNNSVKLF